MNDEFDMQLGHDACPKRLWVMLTLSDDEALDAEGELPLGLRVHLKGCESCRKLSEQLLAVSSGLEQLGRTEPPAGAFRDTDQRLTQAIKVGTRQRSSGSSNGRGATMGNMAATRPRHASWLPAARYAVAAAIALAIALPPLWQAGYLGRPATKNATATKTAPANMPNRPGYATTEQAPTHRERHTESRQPSEEALQPTLVPRDRFVSAPEERDTREETLRPRICTFDSYADPPGPEDANCIYRGFPLPRQQKPPRNRR